MMLTNDPVKDAMTHDRELEEKFEQLPVCEICGEHIDDDGYYDVDGAYYHRECFDKKYWRWY